ncbi:MAG: NifU family protein [Rhodospirillales bacterium]|nr:NifU family protein [Rhodospirillales bacterium]
MFIQTEHTPNPATLKFLPGCSVMERGTANFPDSSDAVRSPLATGLFGVDGIAGVFLGADFITVTKSEDKDWEIIKPQILGAIMEHFQSGKAVIEGEAESAGSGEVEVEGGLEQKIKELIDTRVRPAVAQDGGDIVFKRFEDGIVYLHMQGACAGCPSSTATLKNGIESMLRHYIPEVTEVRAIE